MPAITPCRHPNAKVAAFGNGEVWYCADCNTHIKPEVPRPADPSQDDGNAEVRVIHIAYAAVTAAIALFTAFALILGAGATGHTTPRPQPLPTVVTR